MDLLQKHLLPAFGATPLDRIDYAALKIFCVSKSQYLARSTLKFILATYSVILAEAVKYGLLKFNPVSSRALGRFISPARWKEIEPFTASEIDHLLETCRREQPDRYPLFLLLARRLPCNGMT